jgi:hypothetical protein
VEISLHSPNTPSWRGAQLKEKGGTTLPFTKSSTYMLINCGAIMAIPSQLDKHCISVSSMNIC